MQPVTVVVADDHTIVRGGLISLLNNQRQVRVVGEAEDGRKAVDIVKELRPDVILMDLKMPIVDGVTATQRIVRECPGTNVVMLTVSDTDEDLLAAVAAGATGYLLKNASLEELLLAIEAAAAGNAAFSPSIAVKMLRKVKISTSPSVSSELTAREIQVLRLLAEGASTKEIADRFSISSATARHHIESILSKLGAHSRLEAVACGRRRGVLTK